MYLFMHAYIVGMYECMHACIIVLNLKYDF